MRDVAKVIEGTMQVTKIAIFGCKIHVFAVLANARLRRGQLVEANYSSPSRSQTCHAVGVKNPILLVQISYGVKYRPNRCSLELYGYNPLQSVLFRSLNEIAPFVVHRGLAESRI